VEHIKRDIARVAQAMRDKPRIIQNAFTKAYGRDQNGEVDESLIPAQILGWYEKQ